MSDTPAPSAYSKDNPFPAVVTENRVLSLPGSEKETRHIVINIAGSGLHYKSGDSIGVFPTNRASEVDAILGHLGSDGSELVTLPRTPAPVPLREALTSRLALAGPTRKTVEVLAGKAQAPAEKSKLEGLLAPESKDLLAGWLHEREFVDLLAEFPSARPAPQELVEHMRKLMPRLYSIASSPVVHPSEVHLTVAVVRYSTNGRDRVGVATTFLADRAAVGTTPTPVFISHSHFGLPEDGSRDVIMVGPGTGIAPFRAFVQERAAKGSPGRNWLFFGEQRRATDFLYEEDWDAWKRQGTLSRLDTAFSRDQLTKIYVQDRMRENAPALWEWIKGGAHFYVCGDAKRMAKDVDIALHDVIAAGSGMPTSEVAEYVKMM
ncbi:MAG TPA: sulfite reductase subunit alpha, partial [Planctomycetota bacterium]|nr:sulfite reductase subunit alpha [Planctomycetota bacterium]